MQRPLIRSFVVLTLALATVAGPASARTVVVELFQSQGCSTCPPADANLARIADRPDVIALSYAVTYWDHLGWKDTFAQPKFHPAPVRIRQSLRHPNVFTPQVVVDGRKDGSGIDRSDFLRLVEARRRRPPGRPCSLRPDAVSLGDGRAPASPDDVWLVRYDPRTFQVAIGRGENSGKTLPHRNIVRDLVRIGHWSGAAETLAVPPPADPAWRTAILVQAPKAGRSWRPAKD